MPSHAIKDLKWLEACDAMATIMQKCSKAAYFAFIVDNHSGRVHGCGYNGTPSGMLDCIDGGCPRASSGVPPSTPYDSGPGLCTSVHAEMNALSGVDRLLLERSTLYLNGTCCFGCAKHIANSGLKRVVFYEESRQDFGDVEKLFVSCNITLEVYQQ